VLNLLEGMKCPIHIVADPAKKWPVFSAVDVAMATSGTVGLELAVADVPHVISYKMAPWTWAMIKDRLTTRFAHLGNILLNKPIIPEFIQNECLSYDIDMSLRYILREGKRRNKQLEAFEEIRSLLKAGKDKPSDAAAKFILKAASK
jgi:lipid-A-disaccharide synthase